MMLRAIEAGQGAPVALLHGLFGQATNFGTIQKRLADRFRVLALDLRNHGSSPHAPSMTYREMASDVIETLAALDALPCRVVGHSMGGKVAMRAALDHPEMVERLVVADIAPVRYPARHRAYIDAMMAVPLRPGLTRAEADAALVDAVPSSQLRGFLLASLRTGTAPAWRLNLPAIGAAMPEIEDWPDEADTRYDGPTLFIAGESSDYVGAAHRPVIRRLFPAARVVTLKNAGHWLHADNPNGFVALLDGFLA